MVSREKGLAAAFRASPGTLAAPCTGVLARCWTMALPTQPHMSMKKAGGISGYPQLLFSLPHPGCWGEIGGRGASGYSLLLFCCRSPVVAGGWRWGASGCSLLLFLLPQSGGCGRLEMWAERFRECRGAAAKRGRRCIRAGPGIPLMSRADTGGTAHKSTPGQNPRTRRRERSGRSPECRRQSLFLLHHQKAHSLFPLQEKENGGFEAAGLHRHFPAPGTGAPPPLPRRGNQSTISPVSSPSMVPVSRTVTNVPAGTSPSAVK